MIQMNLLAILFLVIGIFCAGYTAAIISYSGMNTAFLWFWIMAALGCFILSILLRLLSLHKIEIGVHLKYGFAFLLVAVIILFLVTEGMILYHGNKEPQPGADYVIVLGAQVRGTVLSKALKKRLDTAYEYLEDNKSARVIVSGGQGSGEDISEARAMYAYLSGRGIAADRIIMEDNSRNTYENLLYSQSEMGTGEHNTVIVTNSFHVFRAVNIAKKLGLKEVSGLGAPTDDILTLHYYIREFFAVIKDKLIGNI